MQMITQVSVQVLLQVFQMIQVFAHKKSVQDLEQILAQMMVYGLQILRQIFNFNFLFQLFPVQWKSSGAEDLI